MNRFVVISGCSGGGKSALIAELKARGHAVVTEPGRRIVSQERQRMGRALPWIDPAAFAQRAVQLALHDRVRARAKPGLVFFDRGLVDAAAALEHATGKRVLATYAPDRYNPLVFVTPPWPEIFSNDASRRHGLPEAIEEYERLLEAYASLAYDIYVLPKLSAAERADEVLLRLRQAGTLGA